MCVDARRSCTIAVDRFSRHFPIRSAAIPSGATPRRLQRTRDETHCDLLCVCSCRNNFRDLADQWAEAVSRSPQDSQDHSNSVLPVPRTAEFSNGSAGEPRTKPRAYLADGLTPDEATSAYVYDLANRSVVNIATRIGSERTFFRQNRTEGRRVGFCAGHRWPHPDELSRDRRSAANPGDAVQRKILRCGTSWCRPHQRYRRHQTRRSPGVTESSNDWRFQRAESWNEGAGDRQSVRS